MSAGPRETVRKVLETTRTIAVVGASHKPVRPSHSVMRFLQGRGYRCIPVNPGLAGQSLLGEPVYARLADVPEPIDMVDVFRASDAVPDVVEEALALPQRPRVIWLQLGVRHEEAARRAEDAGMTVIRERCPAIEIPHLFEPGWRVGGGTS